MKKAELPAVPAASKKGASGKQQLEANATPPSAARLARIMRVERGRLASSSFLFIIIALFPGAFTKRLQSRRSSSIHLASFIKRFTTFVTSPKQQAPDGFLSSHAHRRSLTSAVMR